MHECLEPVADILPVQRGDRFPGVGEALVRQVSVGIVIAVLVVADDPDPVATGRYPPSSDRLQRRGDTPLGLVVEPLGVWARLLAVCQLPPEPRRRPDLTDEDVAVEQVAEPAAVVEIAMGQG